ncbi:unnamed protein product [Effrenium voratum]|nr:unnamed protein product [Effrenium voratum]
MCQVTQLLAFVDLEKDEDRLSEVRFFVRSGGGEEERRAIVLDVAWRRTMQFCAESRGGTCDWTGIRIFGYAGPQSLDTTPVLCCIAGELHMDDNAEIQTWAQALRTALETNAKAKPTSPASASGECEALKAKSAKLQQRIASLETLSERRDKQMKRLLKRLDGAMQMLEALEDMCGQQRKVIQAQQQAIVALKEEGVDTETAPGPANPASPAGPSSPEREEEEEEEGEDGDVSEEKLMALLAQADQMERALKQMEALGMRIDRGDWGKLPTTPDRSRP